jgi:hypothetical protein
MRLTEVSVSMGEGQYGFYEAEKAGEKSSAAYVAAEAAYNTCLKKMAAGAGCDCQAEKTAKQKAYGNLVNDAVEAGKAANGLFPPELPVGAVGKIPRPTADPSPI